MLKKIIIIALVSFIEQSAFAQNLPLPNGQSTWNYSGAVSPVSGNVPADMKPVGVGSVGAAGNTVTLAININQFQGPVDIYLALYYPAISPNIYLLTSSHQLQALSGPMPKWKQGLSAPVNEALFSNLPIGGLPSGECYIGLLVTPAGDLSRYYLWVTHFTKANIVFVTSVGGTGNLATWADAGGSTGIDAGDAVCAARAQAAGLYGDFRAWMSDDNNDAYCRIHNLSGKKSANCGLSALPVAAGPWIRTDGFPFGESIDELLNNGKVYSPLRYDEFGNSAAAPERLLTATAPNGTLHPSSPSPCSNWTSAASVPVDDGSTDATSYSWTSYGGHGCDGNAPLACFQTGAGPSLPAFGSSGKKAFVTSMGGNGNIASWDGAGGANGIAAADSVCQSRAASAGLPNAGRFKAWLSDSTVNAKDRITSDGPWVRLDGVRVADSKTALISGRLFSPVNYTETGTYIGNHAVWTGTASDGTKKSENCSDWTSGSNSLKGTVGSASDGASGWTNYYPTSCDFGTPSSAYVHLYCFED